MNKKLQLLDSFKARGSDGQTYVVHGYEHLAQMETFPADVEHWEPTGQTEYKLADGRRVEVDAKNVMRVADTDIVLEREAAA